MSNIRLVRLKDGFVYAVLPEEEVSADDIDVDYGYFSASFLHDGYGNPRGIWYPFEDGRLPFLLCPSDATAYIIEAVEAGVPPELLLKNPVLFLHWGLIEFVLLALRSGYGVETIDRFLKDGDINDALAKIVYRNFDSTERVRTEAYDLFVRFLEAKE